MPAYERNFYYPVRFGDVYHSRYQVLSKLGFGANSTVSGSSLCSVKSLHLLFEVQQRS